MTDLKLYTVAFQSQEGQPRAHSAWVPAVDLSNAVQRKKLTAQLLGQALDTEFSDDAADMGLFTEFEGASVQEAPEPPSEPTQSIRRTIQRWCVMDGAEGAHPAEPTYNLLVTQNQSGQTVVEIGHVAGNAQSELPRLTAMFEINEGLPCLHLYAAGSDDCATTFFAPPGESLFQRSGDAQHLIENMPSSFQPRMARVVEACSLLEERERKESRSEAPAQR